MSLLKRDGWLDRFLQANFWAWPALLALIFILVGFMAGFPAGFLTAWFLR